MMVGVVAGEEEEEEKMDEEEIFNTNKRTEHRKTAKTLNRRTEMGRNSMC